MVQPIYIGCRFPCLSQVWIARFNPDGSTDGTFHWPLRTWRVSDATLQPDGKIILAGAQRVDPLNPFIPISVFMVARVNADGTLDTSFGTDGIATVPLGDSSEANAVALQPDGDILAVGAAATGSLSQRVVARFNPDGTPDPEFGSGGVVVAPLSVLPYQTITKIVIVPDGAFLVIGSTRHDPLDPTNLDEDFLLQRSMDGTRDPTFGIGGIIRTDFAAGGSVDRAHGVAVQPDGRLIAVGQAGGPPETDADFGIARYSAETVPADPLALLDVLIEDVNGLSVSGALHTGSASSLVAKLNAARPALEADKRALAENQLSAFINEVNALVHSRRLTAIQGQALTDAARAVIALLSP